jgi:hypothetical protein
MKINLKTSKPRNPFVAASLRRMAGSHRPQGGACRQQAKSALRREVAAGAPADRHKSSP